MSDDPPVWVWHHETAQWVDVQELCRPVLERMFIEGAKFGHKMAREEAETTYRERMIHWLTRAYPKLKELWVLRTDEELADAARRYLVGIPQEA